MGAVGTGRLAVGSQAEQVGPAGRVRAFNEDQEVERYAARADPVQVHSGQAVGICAAFPGREHALNPVAIGIEGNCGEEEGSTRLGANLETLTVVRL